MCSFFVPLTSFALSSQAVKSAMIAPPPRALRAANLQNAPEEMSSRAVFTPASAGVPLPHRSNLRCFIGLPPLRFSLPSFSGPSPLFSMACSLFSQNTRGCVPSPLSLLLVHSLEGHTTPQDGHFNKRGISMSRGGLGPTVQILMFHSMRRLGPAGAVADAAPCELARPWLPYHRAWKRRRRFRSCARQAPVPCCSVR